MLGTIFLYLYWPSFNAALAPDIYKQRIVFNTALSISGACIGACAVSRLVHMKLDMEIVLNATIAGGVMIGACADILVAPGIAIIIGAIAGIVSAIGFAYLSAALRDSINLHDTCGVHNLHGIPGFLGGITGAITAATAQSVYTNPIAATIMFPEIKQFGVSRTFKEQGGYQLAALFTTMGIALLGGAFSGFIASKVGRTPKHLFEDGEHWHGVNYDFPVDKDEDEHEPEKESHSKNKVSALEETAIKHSHKHDSKPESFDAPETARKLNTD
jgi:ammonium transporter Rh